MLDKFEPVAGTKYALVFGNEVEGVSQEVVDLCDSAIEIPQLGTKHSLNVSVSAAVLCYEAVRQRNL
jgi:tRNA G18 (ribose-2'-O)-methylase SpoU